MSKTIDDYIAAQPAPAQPILEKVRATLRKALPKAEEIISYGMPAYRIPQGVVIYFAGWKKHYSIYPAIEGVAEEFKAELAGYEMSKGTIRFPLDEPVPVRLITRIARFRQKAVEARLLRRRNIK